MFKYCLKSINSTVITGETKWWENEEGKESQIYWDRREHCRCSVYMDFAQRNLLFGPRCSWTWALHGGERRWGAGGLREQDLEPDALALYLAPAPATV